MMGLLTSITALAIDMMLPSLPQIGAELSPLAPQNVHVIVGVFLFGYGFGMFFIGPVTDALGRKPVLIAGLALYAVMAALLWQSQSLDLMTFARFWQGIGAAIVRIAVTATVRDQFSGREMAATQSLIMMIFTIVPAIAPLLGAAVAAVFGWRAIFLSFVLFAVVLGLWFQVQQPETLPKARRTPFRLGPLLRNMKLALSSRRLVLSIGVMTGAGASLFTCLMASPLIFDGVFQRPGLFPYAFGGVAVVSAMASFLNARIVQRLGMVRVIRATLVVAILGIAAAAVAFPFTDPLSLLAVCVFLVAQILIFSTIAITSGNAIALGLEDMAEIAGTATSVLTATSTSAGALVALAIMQVYNGGVLPLLVGFVGLYLLSLACAYAVSKDHD